MARFVLYGSILGVLYMFYKSYQKAEDTPKSE